MATPTSITSNDDLPSHADVVVIGAGIAGIATALELVERGVSVVVCEKGIVAGEQSSRNWGWCRQMGRDPRELPLMHVSLLQWRQMHQRTGEDVGFRECGVVYACENERQLAARHRWVDAYAKAYDLSTRKISATEVRERAPGASVQWTGGIFTPDDGRAEPFLAVPAMARAAQKKGAQIFQHCAVRGLLREAGRISGVMTELGEIKTTQVVLAGGAWSRRFCHNEDIFLPQLSVVNSVIRTASFDAGLDHTLGAEKFAVRKRADGGYTLAHGTASMVDIMPDSFRLFREFAPLLRTEWLGNKMRFGKRWAEEAGLARKWSVEEVSPFERIRTYDPKPVARIQNEMLRELKRVFPVFSNVQIEQEWAGVIDVTPDVVPVISAVNHVPGFYMATGFSGHGFGLGPGAGKLMANLVLNETPCVDPDPFDYSRF